MGFPGGLRREARRTILKHMLNHVASLDRAFRALADPTRRSIVEGLTQGSRSVSELAEPLDMSLSGVMQHLQVLESSGLVASEKRGRVRTCTLRAEALGEVEDWIARRRTLWERRLDRLGDYLDAHPPEPGEEA